MKRQNSQYATFMHVSGSNSLIVRSIVVRVCRGCWGEVVTWGRGGRRRGRGLEWRRDRGRVLLVQSCLHCRLQVPVVGREDLH